MKIPRPSPVEKSPHQRKHLNADALIATVRDAFGSIPDCEEALRVGADRYLQFRRDLDRVADVARELVTMSATTDRTVDRSERVPRGMTAAEARLLAQQELREELQKHLIDCRGNIAEMARRMDRDRSTIRYHLRRMGMLQSEERELVEPSRTTRLRRIDD